MQRDIYLFRIGLLVVALLGGFFALGMRFYYVQIERHEELSQKARRTYTHKKRQQGSRGRIYDKSGNMLAGNLACRDLLAEPARFTPRLSEVISLLDQYLQIDKNVVKRRFVRAVNPELNVVEVVVKRELSIQKARRIADLLRENDLEKGFRFIESTKRYYPKGELLANTLGFLNPEGQGACGIEKRVDARLRASEWSLTYEADRLGHQLHALRRSPTHSSDGANVYLTVKEPIQQIVENEITRVHKKHGAEASFAVMMNPDSGEIMAMAQRPTFNPNKRRQMSPDRWRNQLITEGFEPGSIMKPLSIAGALDYGVVSLDDTYDCEEGLWYYAGEPLHDAHKFGELPVWGIIQKSSNIGTAKIALQLGDRRLYQTLSRFGFGEPTGIGFENEASGILRSREEWSRIASTRLPIGQGILVTPLQLVQAYAALANDGIMMEPRIIDRIEHPRGGVAESMDPRAKRRTVRPETASRICNVLQLVTQAEGTAPEADVPGYETAGKTGTAQKVIDGEYSQENYVSSFIGFVPADDPAFVLLVSVDDPSRNGYYASQVAAPAFSRIAEQTLRYLQVSPEGLVYEGNFSSESSENRIADVSEGSLSNIR